MELQTINQVAKTYDVSSRMLRYYEQAGLIKSFRNKDNSYRLYDDVALKRIQQIIILRKLRIPVKQIKAIFNNQEAAEAINIFQKSINELDEEITALSTIRAILKQFADELQEKANITIYLDMLVDSSILPLIDSLSFTQNQMKGKFTMNDLDKAAEVLNKLHNVRVVYLPPMTVASAFFTGESPHERAWQAINDFIKQNNLLKIKPDLRAFRIEHSNAIGQSYGHEVWVSIPDDLNVPAPLAKKIFHGGQYAAHVLGDDGFLTYLGLQDWINENDKYQYDYDGNLTRCDPPIDEIDSFGGVRLDPEEILNFRNYNSPEIPGSGEQIDVLFPIRDYIVSDDMPVEIPDSKEKCGFKASIVTKNKFKIIGFTKIINPASSGKECQKGDDGHCVGCGNCGSSADKFEYDIKTDGRLDILQRYKKPGAPILCFSSHDMDSQIRGGWRSSFCLMESDITDVQAFMEHDPYIRTIDAAKWLIFEHTHGDAFDDHGICMKLGYTWNGTISGSFMVYPDGKIGKPDPNDEAEMKGVVYCWYPVK